jgi:REP element-mobilizing transposase RayT
MEPMKNFPVRKKIRLPSQAYRQGHAFFITIRTYQFHPWFRLHAELADSVVNLLSELSATRQTLLYAWCIMPDHIHLLLDDQDVIDFVRLLKGRMTSIAFACEPGQRLWQRTFYDHALRNEESLHQTALYIWENPVRSGIVKEPPAYSWSGSMVWPDWREFYGRE